jgi:hypothetical protein
MCDADDEVEQHWAESLYAARDTRAFVAGAMRRGANNTAAEQRRWGLGDQLGQDEPRTLTPADVGGGNCAFYKSMWQELGGFDEQLTNAGGNDTDFFLRASAAGFECRSAPCAILNYHMPTTAKTAFKRGVSFGRGAIDANIRLIPPLSLMAKQWLCLACQLPAIFIRGGRGWYAWLHIAGKRYAEASCRLSRGHSR